MGAFGDASTWLVGWAGMPWTCLHSHRFASASRALASRELTSMDSKNSQSGLVLRGIVGSGKRELIEDFLSETQPPLEHVWISGSRFAQSINYGAIQFLLADESLDGAENPLLVYGALKRKLHQGRASHVVLEHCGLIDQLTIAVLAQLQGNGLIRLIVIDDQVDPLPHDIEVLLSNDVMKLVPLDLLSLSETKDKIEELLGKRVSAHAAIRLWKFTGGNYQSLHAALHDAQAVGYISSADNSVIVGSGRPPVGNRLRQLAAARLQNLTPEAARLLSILVNHEPKLKDLQWHVLDELQSHSLVQEIGPGKWKVVDPSLKAVLREKTSALPTKVEGSDWNALMQRVSALRSQDKIEQAVLELGQYRLTAERTSSNDASEDIRATLLMAELLLSAGRLTDAAKILTGVSPRGGSARFEALDTCLRHHALTLAAELAARRNNLDFANTLLDSLVCNASTCIEPRHELGCCMAETSHSLIDTLLQVGRWADCRHLIDCILEGGSEDDPELVWHAEAAMIVLDLLTGNQAHAIEQAGPLLAQMKSSAQPRHREVSKMLGALARFTPDRGQLDGEQTASTPSESTTQLGLMLQTAIAMNRADFAMLGQMAREAETRGEALLASHLYALALRGEDGKYAAKNLVRLQSGQKNDLAKALRALGLAVLEEDTGSLIRGLEQLAAMGYGWHITDDSSELFQKLSAAQKRQILRSNKASVLFSSVAADSEGLFSANGSSYGPELTRRERYVALAAASGMSNQQIARKASVSVRTVEGHLYQVYSKLGINKRTQLSNLVSAGQNALSEEFDKA